MFAAIYLFEVKKRDEKTFVESWESLTKLIYEHCGSLGSRLHKESEGRYIAYAYWPSEDFWQNSSDKLPKEADLYRGQMRESCTKIETLHKLNTVSDLLATNPY